MLGLTKPELRQLRRELPCVVREGTFTEALVEQLRLASAGVAVGVVERPLS